VVVPPDEVTTETLLYDGADDDETDEYEDETDGLV
jgi:hypothetical protein